jgi:hypothetical protein
MLFKQPKVLANGNKTTNTVKVEVSYDPETTDAEIEALCECAAQVTGTATFLPFYKTLNLT